MSGEFYLAPAIKARFKTIALIEIIGLLRIVVPPDNHIWGKRTRSRARFITICFTARSSSPTTNSVSLL